MQTRAAIDSSILMAEREGFEPSNTFWDVTHFPGERLRPLGHLSTRAARVPEAGRAIKSSGCPLPGAWRDGVRLLDFAGLDLAHRCFAERLGGRSRLVARRRVEARIVWTRRRPGDLDCGDDECARHV